MNRLTFTTLVEANRDRSPQFKNSKGEPVHNTLDGSDWSRSDWLEAVIGEMGEYANFSKKYRRGDITYEEFIRHARKELADSITYLSILADQLNIDLGQAITDKFNEISERVGADTFIENNGAGWFKAGFKHA